MSNDHDPSLRVFFFHESGEAAPRLVAATSDDVELHARLVIQPAKYLRSRFGASSSGFAWQQLRRRANLRALVVPGLRRFNRLSSWLLRREYRRLCDRYGAPDAVVVDTPWLLEILELTEAPVRIYLANDAYQYFDWDQAETERRERAAVALADLTLAVAPRIVEDFRAWGAEHVELLPTAVSPEFIEAFRRPPMLPAPPADLAAIPGPRVTCVGNINDTYDWVLIEALMLARPAVSLALIGPFMGEPSEAARRVLALPNVHWLGPRPHVDLPDYLAGSDVLLSPLLQNDHNDRRFPLRLTEYMASDRPILSTAIHPLPYFKGEVHGAATAEEATVQLDRMLSGDITSDADSRRNWLAANNWNARADQLVEAIERTRDTQN